ncbi:tyrosine--tRNA ligase [Tumebacillus sp. DT12]|uniref:Tyrosine--tRNA ligase n=1 Tax=Tumebacillus lacus TaxID=2995335 RepID=A0ABT3X1G1_9BACL|nr:tyrosine--tRNA ligase [Tumebacillus lacus]MCX7570755.1 tyrosine--tRNA ligase [Tumebacillus lacus]
MSNQEQVTRDPQVEAEVERQLAVIRRGAVEIIPEEELVGKLRRSIKTGKPLHIKLGLDPSAPDIHLGHTVPLQKMRQFQDLGHNVTIIIGDYTGMIGDPTGKSETRKQLTLDQVRENAATYVEQLYKVLDKEKTSIRYNSEWLAPLNFADVIKLAANTTVARMLERDDFEKRYNSQQAISLHEFFYPLMQGYDSVALECDVELGGTDQKFNLLMGRTLQKEYGKEQQVILTLPIIEGLDGVQKMSKSLGNYIGIDEAPNDMYGKTMSIPDELMVKYFELVTDISLEELAEIRTGFANGSLHPRDLKMRLGREIVTKYHGEEAAQAAEDHFKTVFQKRALPDDMPEVTLEPGTVWIVKLLTDLKMAPSNGEARRLIQGGAVKINEEKVAEVDAQIELQDGMVLQAGKRKFARIHLG